MKSPLYETSAGALSALLATRDFFSVDLYTLTLAQGTVLRYAAFEKDVTWSGSTWTAGDALFDLDTAPARFHSKAGVDVDTWTVTVAPRAKDAYGNAYPDKIGGQPWLVAARCGALDRAVVYVDRAFFPKSSRNSLALASSLAPTGVLRIFGGWMAEVDLSETQAILNINSFMEALTYQQPRDVYQAGCRWPLFSAGCGLSKASYQVAGTVTAVASGSTLAVRAGGASGSGTYVLGRIQITSGANAGWSRTILSVSGSNFQLVCPFPFPVEAGATAILTPGCHKNTSACSAFGNLANFGGQPYIPAKETAL